MNKLRLTTRVLVLNKDKLLLVRNVRSNYWYPPGGGMEDTDDNLPSCAEREVHEETGLRIKVTALAWVREFYDKEKMRMNLETFWIAKLNKNEELNASHSDLDVNGEVEQSRWFSEEEIRKAIVYPEFVCNMSFSDMRDMKSMYIKE